MPDGAMGRRGDTAMHSHRRRGRGILVTCTTFRALVGLVCVVLAAPPAAGAQPPTNVPRIGVLWPYSPSIAWPFAEAFRQRLRALGYVEGQTIALEERWAEGRYDRLPSLAAELVRLNVDIIVTASTPAVQAAQQATRTIPIVMTVVSDPVAIGLAASLARPGGNVTGLSLMHPEVSGKRLQLLKEVVPNVSRVAVLANPSTSSLQPLLRETQAAARTLGVQLQVVEVRGPTELNSAFSAMTRDRARALVVLPDPIYQDQRGQIAALAVKSRLPAIFAWREAVDAGGLMSYGASLPDIFRRAAVYVDKILKGAKPAELPVEQPTRFELAINLKAAKALGLTFPPSVMVRADQVIQ